MATAVLFVVAHAIQQLFEMALLIGCGQPNSGENVAVGGYKVGADKPACVGQVGDEHHAHCYRAAVAPSVVFAALHRMAEGVAVIEGFAQPRFF